MRYLVVKMAEKRKLPMIQSRPDDAAPERPRSHWIGFGLVAIFTLWVPLDPAKDKSSSPSHRSAIAITCV
jgi:hypothetical protein